MGLGGYMVKLGMAWCFINYFKGDKNNLLLSNKKMATRKIHSRKRKTKKQVRKQKGGARTPVRRGPFRGVAPSVKQTAKVHGFKGIGRGWTSQKLTNMKKKISGLDIEKTHINTLEQNLKKLQTEDLYHTRGVRRTLKGFNQLSNAQKQTLQNIASKSGIGNAQELHSHLTTGRANLIAQLRANLQKRQKDENSGYITFGNARALSQKGHVMTTTGFVPRAYAGLTPSASADIGPRRASDAANGYMRVGNITGTPGQRQSSRGEYVEVRPNDIYLNVGPSGRGNSDSGYMRIGNAAITETGF